MKNHIWQAAVPASKHDAVVRALQSAFDTAEVDALEPLTGGRSSALVYKVTVNQQAFVLRLVMETDELRDPARHFTALKAAAAAGIAPPVRYTSAEDAVSIVDFIEHTPTSSGFASETELYQALAGQIKAIHALPLFPPLVNFVDGVDALIERFKDSAVLPEEATAEHFRFYDCVRRAYPRETTDLVSGHNDLNPTNILHQNGRLWIIDWEVAFANDQYLDLASVNVFFGAGERAEETLLTTYFGDTLSDYHRARFFLMQQVCFTYIAMLFMHLVSVMRGAGTVLNPSMETMRLREFFGLLRSGEVSVVSPDEHFTFAKVMLNESLEQMKTVRFQEALRVVESKLA